MFYNLMTYFRGQTVENSTALDVEAGDMNDLKRKQLPIGYYHWLTLNPRSVGALTAQVMNNPEVLAAMQSKLAGMVGLPSGYYDSLPNVVKRRVKALKNLQVEKIKIEGDFFKEVHELEVKYNLKYEPLYKKRNEIVNGLYEPNDEECNFPSDEDEEDDEENEVKDEKLKVEDSEEEKNTKGIPEFWLTIFKNVDVIAENIQEHDEKILTSLKDVRVVLFKDPPVCPYKNSASD